jgi:hypothetical protein
MGELNMYHVIAMAAPAAAAATPDVGSTTTYAIFGSLVGLAIILAKIIEKGFDKLLSKKEDEHHVNGAIPMVQLDPETLKLFHSMQNDIDRNQQLIEDHLEEEKVVVEMVRESTVCLKDVSRINERLAKHFDDRMDRVDDSIRSIHDQVMHLKRAV